MSEFGLLQWRNASLEAKANTDKRERLDASGKALNGGACRHE
jgi:hypothetical protein